MTIYHVTVRPSAPVEYDYRIAAPTAKAAEEEALALYREDILDYMRPVAETAVSPDQDSMPDRFVEDE